MPRTVRVFGPAYLDRVLLVDRPLREDEGAPPLDQSVEGSWEFGEGLRIVGPAGDALELRAPESWPGPRGTVRLAGSPGRLATAAEVVAWHDDLGGMGAGFAAALGGTLASALGPDDDPVGREVARRLREAGIEHRPWRGGHPSDWTLLLTSGPHADKLPIGFRGAHRSWDPEALAAEATAPCDLRVVAGLPNALAMEALRAPGDCVRLFAPAARNMTDREFPLARLARYIDILCCNRREWEQLDGREQVAWLVPILSVTDGPEGALLRFTRPDGDAGRVVTPAFPRARPPRDTNRAGEAHAATLASMLLDEGWRAGTDVLDPDLARAVATRAAAAAALTLDLPRFGFPDPAAIDAALRAGRVE